MRPIPAAAAALFVLPGFAVADAAGHGAIAASTFA